MTSWSAARRRSRRAARACACPHPVPYQEPGEWAACAKCGRWLPTEVAAALGAEPVSTEGAVPSSREDRPGDAPPSPGTESPESPSRAPALGGARPHDSDELPLSPVAPERDSGQSFDWPFRASGTRDRPGEAEAAQ